MGEHSFLPSHRHLLLLGERVRAEAAPGILPRSHPRRSRRVLLALACLLVLVLGSAGGLLVGSGALSRLPLFSAGGQQQGAPATPSVVGRLYFESSGQDGLGSSAGIADEALLTLTDLTPPPAGKRYYAWLITGSVEGSPILLGDLAVRGGQATLFYPGDARHTDLLGIVNRFLITEEDVSAAPPVVPTPDRADWRYAAAFSQVPNPQEDPPYSLLDHLHHLLSSDPVLDDPAIGMEGGLDIWLFRDSQQILEWAGSARDAWGKSPALTALLHRQLIRILQELDGWRAALPELPSGTPVLVDSRTSLVPMREMNAGQQPPGLLYHVAQHLTGVAEAPAADPAQRQLAARLASSLTRVSGWLDQVRAEALALVTLTPVQLDQASALAQLEQLATHAGYAFSGTPATASGVVENGVAQIHYAMAGLATMDIVAVQCPVSGTTPLPPGPCL